jgi:hypothetical protein
VKDSLSFVLAVQIASANATARLVVSGLLRPLALSGITLLMQEKPERLMALHKHVMSITSLRQLMMQMFTAHTLWVRRFV